MGVSRIILDELIDNRQNILDNFQKRKQDLKLYDYLQDSLRSTDITRSKQFQNKFKSFYVLRRDEDWCRVYFSILEREKNNCMISFEEILKEMYCTAFHNGKQQIEVSFSSKLIATIRPDLPVYDSRVRENLGLKIPYPGMTPKKRLIRFIDMYSKLHWQVLKMTQCDDFGEIRTSFDVVFPEYSHFTDVKKLDLFLWQYRHT